MKLLYLLLFIFINCILKKDNYEKMISDLENLEKYINEYIHEKSYINSTLTHLIVCYIRIGGYTSKEWEAVGGIIPEDLPSYILTKDEEFGTSAQATQTYREIIMPNGDTIDFVHMFSVMNGIEHGKSFSDTYAHLVGWGSDTEQLLEDIMNEKGDLDYLINYGKDNFFRKKGGFGEADLISDLDGPILLFNKTDYNNFTELIRKYYNSENNDNRINKFIELTFPNLIGKEDNETFRKEIYKIYNNDVLIKTMECEKGLRDPGLVGCYTPSEIKKQYEENQKAAIYVFSDFLFDNYKPPYEPEEQENKEKEEMEEEVKERKKEENEEEEKDEEKEKKKGDEEKDKEDEEKEEEEGSKGDKREEDEEYENTDSDNKSFFLNLKTVYISSLFYLYLFWLC